MSVIKVIGIDLGKSVFHLIGHEHFWPRNLPTQIEPS